MEPFADVFERCSRAAQAQPGPARGRPWLGVRFTCTGAYQRVYRNKAGTCYLAQCPRCGRSVRFKVGLGGTPRRFFEVRCG